ncbi:uncharacterized protein LOC115446288 [Manduca sexta]|uniref:uncharacterized protein LOC115446288 n=1 Tax=Manduca sexta TaxID=7130 RepID=UPI00188F4317|nr:uncharacterized protein LOC115446288 [Manduca sexta]XP_037296629.1 uncharacterized protein LOC115446288 [Manduca sexta]
MNVLCIMSGHAVISCVLVLVLLTGVRSQVCTTLVKSQRPITTSYLNMENVYGAVLKPLQENVPFTQTVNECCPGYVKKDQSSNPSRDNCIRPHCEKTCINGRCSTQNECECYEPYEKHPTHNTCVYKCNPGHKRVNDVCVPHCSKPCRSGRCVAPDKCSCDHGWILNESGDCIERDLDPIICYPPCGNGSCHFLNRCTCWDGYISNINNNNPRCVPSCRNCQGFCVAPGRCECPELFERKYLTADNQDCDCSEDCDTKCFKTACVLTTTTSTAIPQTIKAIDPPNELDNTGISEIYVVVERISKPDNSSVEPITIVKYYNMSQDPWLIIFIITTIIMVALIILVFWEYLRK